MQNGLFNVTEEQQSLVKQDYPAERRTRKNENAGV